MSLAYCMCLGKETFVGMQLIISVMLTSFPGRSLWPVHNACFRKCRLAFVFLSRSIHHTHMSRCARGSQHLSSYVTSSSGFITWSIFPPIEFLNVHLQECLIIAGGDWNNHQDWYTCLSAIRNLFKNWIWSISSMVNFY